MGSHGVPSGSSFRTTFGIFNDPGPCELREIGRHRVSTGMIPAGAEAVRSSSIATAARNGEGFVDRDRRRSAGFNRMEGPIPAVGISPGQFNESQLQDGPGVTLAPLPYPGEGKACI